MRPTLETCLALLLLASPALAGPVDPAARPAACHAEAPARTRPPEQVAFASRPAHRRCQPPP
jgi:hypothetical protein